jgi:SNF2 family DNA or RNA helicase
MGDILFKIIKNHFKYEPVFLHGGTTRKQRDQIIETFKTDDSVKILILTLKAGGTGLNLTCATNVIHYDLWWNPAFENQATDRAYRIGQKQNVMVYRLLTQNSLEEKINNMINSKKELANITLNKKDLVFSELSNEELNSLVKIEL